MPAQKVLFLTGCTLQRGVRSNLRSMSTCRKTKAGLATKGSPGGFPSCEEGAEAHTLSWNQMHPMGQQRRQLARSHLSCFDSVRHCSLVKRLPFSSTTQEPTDCLCAQAFESPGYAPRIRAMPMRIIMRGCIARTARSGGSQSRGNALIRMFRSETLRRSRS